MAVYSVATTSASEVSATRLVGAERLPPERAPVPVPEPVFDPALLFPLEPAADFVLARALAPAFELVPV